LARRRCSLSSCGGGSGWGVVPWATAVPPLSTPAPDPSPQGGGEKEDRAMRKVLYIFGLLTDADVEWIARNGRRRVVYDREILIREGRPVESIIFLLRGEFVVSAQAAGEIARLGAGEIVGEMSFVDSAPPSATVTAAGECLALFIDKEAVARKLDADAAFGCRFYRALAIFLADRLRGTVRRMGYGSASEQSLGSEAVTKDELDLAILDMVSQAGERFDRMLKTLAGEA
jgi:CRP/FNR family cyclic AMP-dependent transcriptional regulator